MKNSITDKWWLLALQGVLTIVIGLVAILKPEELIQTIALFIGIIVIITGVYVFVISLLEKDKSASIRWWTGAGIVLTFTGLVLVLFPNIIVSLFVFILAFWIILMGVFQIQSAIDVKGYYERWQIIMISGIVSLLIGIVFLFNPFETVATLTMISGVYAVILGIIIIMNSLRIKRLVIE